MRLIDEQGRLLGRVNLIDGAAIFFGLFSAALLLHFSYHNLLRHTTLTLEEATPKIFVPGVDQLLAIRGNGFRGDLQVEVDGQPPLSMVSVNEARMDIQLPDDLGPGDHQVMVRSPRGRMITKEAMFQIRWEPVVDTITRKGQEQMNEVTYRITGKYLQPGCAIRVDGTPVLKSSSLSSQEVLITVPVILNEVWTELSIQNPSGGGIVLKGEELLRRIDPDRFLPGAEPRIVRVIPNPIQGWQETGVVILGQDFKKGCTVRIGGQPLKQMGWWPPYLICGSLPAHSIPPGKHPVEVVNSNGKKTTASVVVTDVEMDKGIVDVELFFPGLSRKDLKNGFRIPGSVVQILKILKRRGQANGVYALVRLPVKIRETEGYGSIPLCYYENKLLRISRQVSLTLSQDRVVSAEVRSIPKRVQEATDRKGSQ